MQHLKQFSSTIPLNKSGLNKMDPSCIILCVSKVKFLRCTCQNFILGYQLRQKSLRQSFRRLKMCHLPSNIITNSIKNFSCTTPSNNPICNHALQCSTFEIQPALQTTQTKFLVGSF